MKALYLIICLFGFKAVYAHNPDLSSLMIYEQNGKSILVIKSSLTAFEGEVDYVFGKNAYKTPEEFNQLVIQHFQKNCILIANGNTLKLTNIQVQLGHETTLFAELENMPQSINSLYIKSTAFKDMHHNQCEIILTLNGLPQKQYILDNGNQQEVTLKAENNKWVVDNPAKAFYRMPAFFWLTALFFVAIIFYVFRKRDHQLITAFG